MTSNPAQEREEIKDGLRAVIENQVSLLREAQIFSARGEAIPDNILGGLVASRAAEYTLLVRRAAVDGTNPPEPVPVVTTLPLATIQARMETEAIWEIYVNFMFANATRRNAFMKVMFVGKALEADDAPTRTSMQNALTSAPSSLPLAEAQEIVNRVMAL